MNVLYLFLMIIILSTFLSIKFNKEIGDTVFPSLSILLILLFLLGIIGLLKHSILITGSLVFIILCYCIYKIYKEETIVKKYLLKPALIYIIFLFLLTYFLWNKSFINKWDEFSQWGIYVKNIFNENSLWNTNFTSEPNGYPPIISIFQYFLMKLNGAYLEADLFRGIFLLSTLPLLSFFKNLSFKKPSQIFLYMLILFAIPSALSYDYLNSIYADTVVGILFASAVISLIIEPIDNFNIVRNFVILSILILSKSVGVVMVGSFYIILLIDILFIRRKEYFQYYNENLKRVVSKLTYVFIFLLPIIMRGIWAIFLRGVSVSSKLGNIVDSTIDIKDTSYFSKVINDFIAGIFKTNIGGTNNIISIPSFYWILLVLLLFVILKDLLMNKDEKKQIKLSIIAIVISFTLYTCALLYSYLFSFEMEEAIALASFSRYMITILISSLMILILVESYFHLKGSLKNKIFNYIIIGLILSTIRIPEILIVMKNSMNSNLEYQKFNSKFAIIDKVKNNIPAKNNVYYLSAETDGFDYLVAKYKLTPNKVQKSNYNICISCNDKNKQIVSVDNFKKLLHNYEYLFIYKISDNVKNDYKEVLNINGKLIVEGLYKINVNNNIIGFERIDLKE